LSLVFAPAALAQDDPDPPDPDVGKPENALTHRLDRYTPKPPGTVEKLRLWFGPYPVVPGHDGNRFDIDIPLRNGYLISVMPTLRRATDLKIPSRQEAHIHHAHWFRIDPGNKEDTYLYGNGEWIYGTGDEETKADFGARSEADPNGPIYGQYLTPKDPELMIYMLHNKTNQPRLDYIALDVTFVHGSAEEIAKVSKRPYHDISGALFGRTFNVPRNPLGDGIFSTTRDSPKGPIEWTAPEDGMLIGTGSHLHPGGLNVQVENFGSKAHPCANDGRGTGGTMLLDADARWRDGVKYSEDFQMEVTHPNWRAPIHKGDRIRITGRYQNLRNAWYTTMTHEGLYIDEAQKPAWDGCAPRLINFKAKRHMVRKRVLVTVRKRINGAMRVVQRYKTKLVRRKVSRDPVDGVITKPWYKSRRDPYCGVKGSPACERDTYTPRPAAPIPGNTVTIANFLYTPGDLSAQTAPPLIHQGESLTFINADEAAGIRHSVTTCPWPCAGTYVSNYPWSDGVWDSTTLGYDIIDGGNPNPVATTPGTLDVGKYAYYCRIHPWMRGSFEVAPKT
jgi:plastocyanin